MSLPNRFIDYIQKEGLFQKRDRLVVAVSGGIDSAVLCELCRQGGYHFEIAHCNFQLRGEESTRDETFVKSLGEKYNAKVWVKKFETLQFAAENKLGIQEAARNLRYGWFEEIMNVLRNIPTQGSSAPYLLTAHHANDSVETLLINFFKGTGIKGMQGIQNRHEKFRWIARPLLFAKREEIVNFAREEKLLFVEDSSNASDKYTRNYFRNQLIPSIEKVFPQVQENLLANIERFGEAEILYQQAVSLHKKKLLEYKGSEVHVPVLKLLKIHPLRTVIYEIIKEYGFTPHQTEEVLHLLKSDTGKYISSLSHKIILNRKWLIIAPHNTHEASLIVINEVAKEIEFAAGKIKIDRLTGATHLPLKAQDTATLDAKLVTYPLLLRKWKQGDYFYPLGMHKKKKLSRFFIDQKMSLKEKENTWIIESDKRIIWIIGRRIDDRFKIVNSTTDIITIQFRAL